MVMNLIGALKSDLPGLGWMNGYQERGDRQVAGI
jgi:hypothetical protein